MEQKIKTLAKHLECDIDEITEGRTFWNRLTPLECDNQEYIVLTDREADEACRERIKESVWAFNANFLAGYCELPTEVFEALRVKCGSSNEAILSLIEKSGGLDGFVSEAVSSDGRSHFLAIYDGEEIEEGDYFIYRIN